MPSLFHRFLPVAAERFHQRDGGDELLATQLHGAELDVQFGALRRRHIEERGEPVAVTVVGHLELQARGNQGSVFRFVLIGKQGLGREIVFNLGESGQHGLPVG